MNRDRRNSLNVELNITSKIGQAVILLMSILDYLFNAVTWKVYCNNTKWLPEISGQAVTAKGSRDVACYVFTVGIIETYRCGVLFCLHSFF